MGMYLVFDSIPEVYVASSGWLLRPL